MPWALLDEYGDELYRLPASLWPDQRHVGGEARVRFVRGYGSEDWFVTRDGLREAANVTIVGSLQTDRDEAGTQALISELVSAASEARYLGHLDASGVVVEVLPLLGALPITTEPDGVDGSMVVVTLPLIPGGEWTEFIPPPAPDEYTYEVFTESGVWDWNAAGQPDEVDVLVVAGGGGGGSRQGGGGGAGGVVIQTGVPVTGDETVTVGAGGVGIPGTRGSNGEASSFGAITAAGGGGGGSRNGPTDGAPGGAGGGGAGRGSGGSGTAGQGHSGGAGNPQLTNSAGGGGGASAAGEDALDTANQDLNEAGDGGAGVTLGSLGWGDAVTEGAPAAVGGGGGGGTFTVAGSPGVGGLGGGGNGTTFQAGGVGHAAAVNTGGGGGGAGDAVAGGAGGSGVVIVRWRQDG